MKIAIKKAGLLLVPLMFLTTSQVSAVSKDSQSKFAVISDTTSQIDFLAGGSLEEDSPKDAKSLEEKSKDDEDKPENKAKRNDNPEIKPIIHTITEGDNLSLIAEKYETTWRRLFDKNTKLENPDVLNIGDKLIVPFENEDLKQRDLPAAQIAPSLNYPETTTHPATNQPVTTYAQQPGQNTAGNTYTAGYCTWYVKNRRPDIPNMLGDAISWVSSARARGMATGSTPRVGAVGQQGNHVVYVEAVDSKSGMVTISEMNYKGLYIINQRTVPASSFTYIY